jgi:CelD/BcsL family acetyltransferase involved in cellulose biosynthesis
MPQRGPAPSAKELEWRVLRHRDLLPSIAGEWNELHVASRTTNPFSHPAWIEAWLEHFTRPEDLYVVTARERGQLVALAPFHRRGPRPASPFPGSCLRLAGMGASEVITELPEILIGDVPARKVMRGLMGFLLGPCGDDWDWLELSLSNRAGWFESDWIGSDAEARGAAFVPRSASACVVIDLPESWDLLRSGMKRNVKEAVRRSTNRLAKLEGGWETVHPSNGHEFQEALESLLRLHRARSGVVEKEQHANYLSDPRDEAFLRDAAMAMYRAGRGTIAEIRVEGTTAAAGLLLRANGAVFFSVTGLDPRFWDLGLGTQLKVQALQQAIADGDTVANLSINPDESKRRWSESLEFHHEFLVVSTRRRAAAAAGAYLMHRAAREAHSLRR